LQDRAAQGLARDVSRERGSDRTCPETEGFRDGPAQLSNAERVRVGGLVQLTVRVKPAQKKRKGRNPATGEEITIAAKPASVDLRARPLAAAKVGLPSVQKARRRLAARG
jgi:hypothetical protein